MTDRTRNIIINLLATYEVFPFYENNIFSQWIHEDDIMKLELAKDALDNVIEKLLEKHKQFEDIWMDSDTFFEYIANENSETILLNAFYGGGCNGADVTGKFNPNDNYFQIDVYEHYYSCGWRDYKTVAHDLSRHIDDKDFDDMEVEDAIIELIEVLDIEDEE